VIDGKITRLEILDTAGQEEFTALRDQWIRDSEGFLIIYSITSAESFQQIAVFKEQICRVKDTDGYVPIILVGNKADMESQRAVSTQEGEDLAKALGCLFIETSAKTRLNVENAFCNLVRDIRARQPIEKEQLLYESNGGKKKKNSRRKKETCPIL
jgi:GTPase KRas protein